MIPNQVSLKKFKDSLNKFASKSAEEVGKDMHLAVGQYVYEKIILRTPVLTGHARHNWYATVNTQWDIEREGVFGGSVTGEPITGNERAMWADTRNQIRRMPLGQTIWICNNVPYILRLESGTWSAKAPQGMVEITLREVLEGVFTQQTKMMSSEDAP